MDDIATGKIERTDNLADQRALAAPDHVCERRVHHEHPDRDECGNGAELDATRKRAGDDGGRDHGECHLKRHVHDLRVHALVRVALGGIEHLTENLRAAELVESAEERTRAVSTVGKRPAGNDPQHTDDTDYAEAHHHGVDYVLAARKTAVEKRQTRCHQKHEHGADEHKRRRSRIEHPLSPFWLVFEVAAWWHRMAAGLDQIGGL